MQDDFLSLGEWGTQIGPWVDADAPTLFLFASIRGVELSQSGIQ